MSEQNQTPVQNEEELSADELEGVAGGGGFEESDSATVNNGCNFGCS